MNVADAAYIRQCVLFFIDEISGLIAALVQAEGSVAEWLTVAATQHLTFVIKNLADGTLTASVISAKTIKDFVDFVWVVNSFQDEIVKRRFSAFLDHLVASFCDKKLRREHNAFKHGSQVLVGGHPSPDAHPFFPDCVNPTGRHTEFISVVTEKAAVGSQNYEVTTWNATWDGLVQLHYLESLLLVRKVIFGTIAVLKDMPSRADPNLLLNSLDLLKTRHDQTRRVGTRTQMTFTTDGIRPLDEPTIRDILRTRQGMWNSALRGAR